MKKTICLIWIMAAFTIAKAQEEKNLREVISLEMPKGSGSNGAGVVWHPKFELYYASFAGNAAFPLAKFSSGGRFLKEFETDFDVRGLWYNKNTGKITGNAYNDGGLYAIELNQQGDKTDLTTLLEESDAPTSNSVGAFDPDERTILFLDGNDVVFYNEKFEKSGKALTLATSSSSTYNSTSLIFTGIGKSEIGVLNITKNQVELYDFIKGRLYEIWHLPKDAPLYETVNFSYANGIVWLFDKENRMWRGYK